MLHAGFVQINGMFRVCSTLSGEAENLCRLTEDKGLLLLNIFSGQGAALRLSNLWAIVTDGQVSVFQQLNYDTGSALHAPARTDRHGENGAGSFLA